MKVKTFVPYKFSLERRITVGAIIITAITTRHSQGQNINLYMRFTQGNHTRNKRGR